MSINFMVVVYPTLLTIAVVISHSFVGVNGWRWRHHLPPAPPSLVTTFHQRQRQRPHKRRHPCPYVFVHPPSQLRRHTVTTLRGGDDDRSSSSSTVVSEKEGVVGNLPECTGFNHYPPPPKIPNVIFPDRASHATHISTTTTTTTIKQQQQQQQQRLRILVIMDSFCDVHGLFLAQRARDMYGVATLRVYSDYMRGYFQYQEQQRGDHVVENMDELLSMCMPSSVQEVQEWRARLDGIVDAWWRTGDTNHSMDDGSSTTSITTEKGGYELTAVVCDSDSGLAHAEQLAIWLNVTARNPGEGVALREDRRNKYHMIETLRHAGIDTVQQRLCQTRDEAVEFATTLLLMQSMEYGTGEEDDDYAQHNDNDNVPSTVQDCRQECVVLKPVRGCGSDDVYLCHDAQSVMFAFDKIHGSGIFGSPGQTHGSVLVQEFAHGQEYAIDTVSRDGELKIVAIWKYDKRPVNGAPFVYYATRLFDDNHHHIHDSDDIDPICPVLYEYLNRCLIALDIRWGLTHSEIIITPNGPRLVEVNCRQHNMDFLLLTMGGIGYNLYDVLLSAYFGSSRTNNTNDDDDGISSSNNNTIHNNNKDCLLHWDHIPYIPTTRMNAAMVHLANSKEGKLKSVNTDALYEIEAMASVGNMEVYNKFLEVGTHIHPTVDIKSDAGWVQLVHPDSEIFEADFQRILELMPILFDVDNEVVEEEEG